jgi:hypothetical protein
MRRTERGRVLEREDERLRGSVAARVEVAGRVDEAVLMSRDPLVLGQPINREVDGRTPHEKIRPRRLTRAAASAAANYKLEQKPHAELFAKPSRIACGERPAT